MMAAKPQGASRPRYRSPSFASLGLAMEGYARPLSPLWNKAKPLLHHYESFLAMTSTNALPKPAATPPASAAKHPFLPGGDGFRSKWVRC